MSIALPSKKIQAAIIVVIAIFLAYFVSVSGIGAWVRSFTATADNSDNAAALQATALRESDSDQDTDNDGLKDWQEALWGTNIKEGDSDGDGTKDGEEIEKGRDPGTAGPDDSLESTRGISASSVASFSASASVDPDNISDAVSRDLFTKFMSLQTTGNLNDETQAQVVAGVIADIDPGSIPPRYSLSDISVVDATPANLRGYGNAVASILATLEGGVNTNTANDEALLAYDKAISALKNLPVPGTLGLTHLQVLNNFNASYQMLVLLGEYQNDPVKGLVALKSLQTNTASGVELFGTIASEFRNNDIIFDKSEAGYIWNNYR